ncbi:hypothetical protein AYI70_g7821 [Smittium culicis]|uniref:Amine oxidase domain-containing protein n=1 Tax=Smittium culicis TaxID=133412 RepID=A0A1R1XIQ1_9FUNG|nr:hypothetical protein AYI70_g7821 [Smittium culicis]
MQADIGTEHSEAPKKIAVIGSGMPGILASWALTHYSNHKVSLFEKSNDLTSQSSIVDFLPPGIPEKCSIDFLPETRISVDMRPFVFDPSLCPNLHKTLISLRVDLDTFSMDLGASNWSIKDITTPPSTSTLINSTNPSNSASHPNKPIPPISTPPISHFNHSSLSDISQCPFMASENSPSTNQKSNLFSHHFTNQVSSPFNLKNLDKTSSSNPDNIEIGRIILRQNSLLHKRIIAFEWNSSGFFGLFSNLKNTWNLKFYRALLDYFRFMFILFAETPQELTSTQDNMDVLTYLEINKYSPHLYKFFLSPILTSLLTCETQDNINTLPIWIVKSLLRFYLKNLFFFKRKFNFIKGGKLQLFKFLKNSLLDVRYNTEITKITKLFSKNNESGVQLTDSNGNVHQFDAVIVALKPKNVIPIYKAELSSNQLDYLRSIHFVKDSYVLHTDTIVTSYLTLIHLSNRYIYFISSFIFISYNLQDFFLSPLYTFLK